MDGSHSLTTGRLISERTQECPPAGVVRTVRTTPVCRGPLVRCASRAGDVTDPKFIGPQPPSFRPLVVQQLQVHGPGDVNAPSNYSLRLRGRGQVTCALNHVDFGAFRMAAAAPGPCKALLSHIAFMGARQRPQEQPQGEHARCAMPAPNRWLPQRLQQSPAQTHVVQDISRVILHA
jgi:hypothetical protein